MVNFEEKSENHGEIPHVDIFSQVFEFQLIDLSTTLSFGSILPSTVTNAV